SPRPGARGTAGGGGAAPPGDAVTLGLKVTGVDQGVPGSESWALTFLVDGWRIILAPMRGADGPYRVSLSRPGGGRPGYEEVATKVGAVTVEDAVEAVLVWMDGAGVRPSLSARRGLIEIARDLGGAFPDATSLAVTLTRSPT